MECCVNLVFINVMKVLTEIYIYIYTTFIKDYVLTEYI